ncbi:MAG: hypothetical protein JW832_15060 [Deltaproteobacteria bacterium]|nr:hypothetical protein [Deltaproteobacteria bacterium]
MNGKNLIIAALYLYAAMPLTAAAAPQCRPDPFAALDHDYVLIGLGDSLTQGTMDAADNSLNTPHAYLQRVHDSLAAVLDIALSQPLLDLEEKRIAPFDLPTNLGIDGSDVFTMDGLSYYKRTGSLSNRRSRRYLCNGLLPWRLRDRYDNTLYPYNLLCGGPASQLDSAAWLLHFLQRRKAGRGIFIVWIGNNDSSSAALGYGTHNPVFAPLPYSIIESRLRPGIAAVLGWAQKGGLISFEPYTPASIERNLTDASDFAAQFEHVLSRLETDVPGLYDRNDVFICTLPYYSSVGYLFDSDDLEFYLGQLDPSYRVPPSFARAALPGEPVTDFTRGDRVNLITFMCMYGLLATGADAATVNRVLETDGGQNDGLVLSENEQAVIRSRIDEFNSAIRQAVQKRSGSIRLIETGPWLNDILTGAEPFQIDEKRLTRKWVRGSSFTLDGVHPGYTGQAVIANKITESINAALGLAPPPADLSAIMAADPYIDHDGDGWAPGPTYAASGMTGILFLFRDPDDADPEAMPALPADIWWLISDAILKLL